MANLIKIILFVILVAMVFTIIFTIVCWLKDIHEAKKCEHTRFQEFIDEISEEE